MLNYTTDDMIMVEIEQYTLALYSDIWATGIPTNRARAMLNHLTELHRARNAEIYYEVWDGLVEEYGSYGIVMNKNFPIFLQM
jgi:hypothetical protein